MDTRDKRASAIHVAMPWRGLLPLPDGALNEGDRQQSAFLYRGISTGTATAGDVLPALIAQRRLRLSP